ncbi:hypothetical protein K3495_g7786, partial [Podosphaera aphanis]
MISFLLSSLFLIAATIVQASNVCPFHVNASGGISGPIWQLRDGQLRLGGDNERATFQISDGGITDHKGSGCILTQKVRQVQCDRGTGPSKGFSIGENGVLSYNQNPNFYACPASEVEWNIHTVPVAGQLKCVPTTLTADNCGTYYAQPALPVYQSPPPKYPTSTMLTAWIPPASCSGLRSCKCIGNHDHLCAAPTSAYYAPPSNYEQPEYEQPEYEQPKYEKPEYEQPDSGNPYTNPYGYPKYAGSL